MNDQARGEHGVMGENIIGELLHEKRFWRITPPKEKLLEKMVGLEEEIARYKSGTPSDAGQNQILKTCEDYIRIVKELIKAKWFSHPHLAWTLLHRVDERMILLMPQEELAARVVDVKTAFDLTIKEESVRKDWLGDKGKLTKAVEEIAASGKYVDDKCRCMVKEALQYLNNFVDDGFWKLSMNILMSVSSAFLLAVFTLIYFDVYHLSSGIPGLKAFAILGLMGAYLSNLLTKEDFLFVRGGPFFRYLFYNLMARPVIGAFSAVFFFLVEQSKLIFSINSVDQPLSDRSAVLSINVGPNVMPYVYIVFAIAVGFAGEKVLRGMMDKVLKRLEEKAEKTKEISTQAKNSEGKGERR